MCRRPNTVSSSNSCRKSLKLNNKYFFIEKNYIELTSYLRIKWKNSRMNKLMNYHSYRILYRSSFFIPPLYYFSLLLFLYQFLFTHSFINFTAYPYLSILVHCLFYFYASLSLLVQILFIVLICFIL